MRFRTKALAKRRQGEELDRLPSIAKPRGWLAAAALTVLVVALLVGLFAGSIPRRVTGTGVLASDGGLFELQSLVTGEVADITVEPGDEVSPNTVVATVRLPDGTEHEVIAGRTGRVMVVRTGPGRVVEPGTPVVTIAQLPSDPTHAYLFLDQTDAAGVAPGMAVDVHVAVAPPARFGSAEGTVESVGQQPVSPEELDLLLANDTLADQFAQSGAPVLVTVLLTPGDTPSGIAWTGGDGPSYPLVPGALVDADIRQGDQSVLNAVLGSP